MIDMIRSILTKLKMRLRGGDTYRNLCEKWYENRPQFS